MNAFRYVAVRPDGAHVRGRLQAATTVEAARVLADRGLYPVTVDAAASRTQLWRRPSVRDLATAMQSLGALSEVGVPLHQALDATLELTRGVLREALAQVRERVRQGSPLWAAMADERGLFPPVAIGLVRAGERGIGLAAGLAQAARQLEREADTQGKFRAALAYPLALCVVGAVSVGIIVFVVLPRFAALLEDVGAQMPLVTRVLLSGSSMIGERAPWLFLAGGTLAAAAVQLALKHRAVASAGLLESPLVGPIRHGLATARVARALGALLGTGVPAAAALATARDGAGDVAVARRLTEAERRVTEGMALGEALSTTRAFTPGAVQLVRIGERAGRLPELLEQAAVLEERAASARVHALVTALEPALIVGFALIVALVAGAVLQAIYGLRPGLP
jgi:general secretion pathway protein F